jgi:hypothetical protein
MYVKQMAAIAVKNEACTPSHERVAEVAQEF